MFGDTWSSFAGPIAYGTGAVVGTASGVALAEIVSRCWRACAHFRAARRKVA